jgi:hypothetical protein
MARVRIKKLPKALSGLEIKMQPGLYGTNGNRQFTLPTQVNSQKFAQQPTKVRDTLLPVARAGANLEAERGETAVVNIDGLPAHFKIGGKRHTQGGTPLNLPDNSFIFSDTAKMRIKDPVILAQFGMVPKKAGYTPAEIAKKYDINKFRQVLADANSEDLERKTAEMMISNYNMKLAKLALIQESMKGFPQGVPAIAMPYIIENDIDPSTYLPTQSQEEQPDADTGEARYGGNMISQFNTKKYGGLPTAQEGKTTLTNKIKEDIAKQKAATAKQRQEDYENESAYLAESVNSDAIQSLRNLYRGIKKAQGSLSPTNFFDFLPGVTSLEEQAKMFENLSKTYNYDPELLQQKFENESAEPRYKIDPKTGSIKTVYKNKNISNSPIVTEINKKVKDWRHPKEDEIKSLTGYESDYLNNLLVRHKEKTFLNKSSEEQEPVNNVEIIKKPAIKTETKTSNSRKPLHNWD